MSTATAKQQASAPVAYARISQDRYGAGVNSRTQMQDMRALAARLGLPVPDELIDNDQSAYARRKPRPGYRELCEGLAAGRWDTLLIWHADRLHRQPAELEQFMSLVLDHGVRIHTVNGGELDLESPQGQMTARILGAVAKAESDHKAVRLKSKAKMMLDAGRTIGGPRIFGWEADHKTPRPAEAAIVAELTERVIVGESGSSLAREMNARGVPLTGRERLERKRARLTADIGTERDDDARAELRAELERTEAKIAASRGKWSAVMVHHIVRRARNCGLQVRLTRDRHGKITDREVTEVTGEWQPIVTREQWELAAAILNDPARRKVAPGRPRHLLTGLMRCGRCGVTVKAAGGTDGAPRYGCRSCYGVTRRADLCDEYMLRVIGHWLAGGHITAAAEPGRLAESTEEEHELKGRRTQLAELFAAGVIDEAALQAGTTKIREQLDAMRREHRPRKPRASRGVTAETWRSLPTARQREVIREIAEVTLLPQRGGTTFRPGSISIVPREDGAGDALIAAAEAAAQEVAALERTGRAVTRGPQPRHQITCDNCGRLHMTGNSRGRYCSQKCGNEARKAGIRVAAPERKHERTCEICGATFMAAKRTAHYCGPACHSKAHRLRAAAGQARQLPKTYTRRCRMCLETFTTAKADALYCSKECRSASVRQRRAQGLPPGAPGGVKAIHLRTCDVCGRQYLSAKRNGVAHCSPNCRAKAYYREHRAEVLAKRKAEWQAKRKAGQRT
jgi:DNA invertase Pin-like site-specific DNA recombinase